ncbi:MAG TPA: hypothetical protein VIY52_20505 [Streptosporangiaceae bacterium]
MPRLRGSSLSDHLEAIVDAELGILLRYEETFEGQRLSLTELTAIVLDPPEAADRSRFAPPAGSRIGQGLGKSLRQTFSGPDWQAAKTGVGLAAGGLGALVRCAPPPTSSGGRAARSPLPGASWMICAAGAVVKSSRG